jgi:hypothetical protein
MRLVHAWPALVPPARLARPHRAPAQSTVEPLTALPGINRARRAGEGLWGHYAQDR